VGHDILASFPPSTPLSARTHGTEWFPGYKGACLEVNSLLPTSDMHRQHWWRKHWLRKASTSATRNTYLQPKMKVRNRVCTRGVCPICLNHFLYVSSEKNVKTRKNRKCKHTPAIEEWNKKVCVHCAGCWTFLPRVIGVYIYTHVFIQAHGNPILYQWNSF
jgi:hypothetical protein